MSDTSAADLIFAKLNDAHRILDEPQFSISDAAAVVGASVKAIEHMIDPKKQRVQLNGDHISPGSGRKRLFNGSDILKLAAAVVMSQIGFPQRWSVVLTDVIDRRASNRITGLAEKSGLLIATYPMKNGDWAYVSLYADGSGEETELPVAMQMLDVDRLIDETIAKLEAIIRKAAVPDFSVPDPVPEPSPFSPENDFFRMWDKDGEGRDVYVGLTYEQTQERERLKELWLADRSQGGSRQRILFTKEDGARLKELDRLHESAKLKRNHPDLVDGDDGE